ncbi:MAG: acyl-CoA dehydrogenase [Candidatus Tectimicrobiota bacterium]|nr:MAG: acyl-CoA dehydrogenase [Candidatus Tectomicrobia bacterium]
MDFALPAPILERKLTARRFVDETCIPLERELEPDWIELPPELHRQLEAQIRALGLWAVGVPRELGGEGMGALGYTAIREEQCRTVIGTSHYTPFGGELPAPLYFASEEQKARYVLPILRGEKKVAFAQTEPGAGSDAAAIETRAVRDGDGWRLSGVKRFATLADRADVLLVVAVTDPEKRARGGITMFLVDRDTPGLRVHRILKVLRPQHSTEIVLDNVFVPQSNVLGEVGQGFAMAQKFLVRGRMSIAARCLGVARRALEMSLAYARERHTFGQPLAERQAVQWMLADSYMEWHAARLLTYETAWKEDQGHDPRVEASEVKCFATEMAFRVLDRAIQVHGGIGLTKDLPLERWFREIRVLRIGEGPNEIHRWVVARSLLRGQLVPGQPW